MDVNIKDYGAVGDGQTLNTAAIQSAIDACFNAGGGKVTLSHGIYMTGTILLKGNVTLHIEASATLLGSPNCGSYENPPPEATLPYPYNCPLTGIINDYGDYPDFPKNHVSRENLPRNRGCCLIYAEDCENIAITGEGKIDANGKSFVELVPQDVKFYKKYRRIHAPTPPRIVFFTGCKNVKLEGITVTNGPAGWAFWIHDCDKVSVDKVIVDCDLNYPNNDGIHINCSRDVTVSNCKLSCSDDCVVVRANSRSLKENKPSERVTVTNCTMVTRTAGVRIAFTCDGVVRNCTFSNLTITDSPVGVLLALPDKALIESDFGREETLVENLRFSNIVMDRIDLCVSIASFEGPQNMLKALRNIAFDSITANCKRAIRIKGTKDVFVEDISFSNCRFSVKNAENALILSKCRHIDFNNTTISVAE